MLTAYNLYRLSFWSRLCSNSHMVHECNYLFDSFESALSYAIDRVNDSCWCISNYSNSYIVARSAYAS